MGRLSHPADGEGATTSEVVFKNGNRLDDPTLSALATELFALEGAIDETLQLLPGKYKDLVLRPLLPGAPVSGSLRLGSCNCQHVEKCNAPRSSLASLLAPPSPSDGSVP